MDEAPSPEEPVAVTDSAAENEISHHDQRETSSNIPSHSFHDSPTIRENQHAQDVQAVPADYATLEDNSLEPDIHVTDSQTLSTLKRSHLEDSGKGSNLSMKVDQSSKLDDSLSLPATKKRKTSVTVGKSEIAGSLDHEVERLQDYQGSSKPAETQSDLDHILEIEHAKDLIAQKEQELSELVARRDVLYADTLHASKQKYELPDDMPKNLDSLGSTKKEQRAIVIAKQYKQVPRSIFKIGMIGFLPVAFLMRDPDSIHVVQHDIADFCAKKYPVLIKTVGERSSKAVLITSAGRQGMQNKSMAYRMRSRYIMWEDDSPDSIDRGREPLFVSKLYGFVPNKGSHADFQTEIDVPHTAAFEQISSLTEESTEPMRMAIVVQHLVDDFWVNNSLSFFAPAFAEALRYMGQAPKYHVKDSRAMAASQQSSGKSFPKPKLSDAASLRRSSHGASERSDRSQRDNVLSNRDQYGTGTHSVNGSANDQHQYSWAQSREFGATATGQNSSGSRGRSSTRWDTGDRFGDQRRASDLGTSGLSREGARRDNDDYRSGGQRRASGSETSRGRSRGRSRGPASRTMDHYPPGSFGGC